MDLFIHQIQQSLIVLAGNWANKQQKTGGFIEVTEMKKDLCMIVSLVKYGSNTLPAQQQ